MKIEVAVPLGQRTVVELTMSLESRKR